jgi:glutamate formiminotransferase/formiminotetrahydrofolate cyclodeaminase
MVANLSSHKRGWDDRWEAFSDWAVRGKEIQNELLRLVDEDTHAFNRIMEAFGLPKKSEEEKKARQQAIREATLRAIEVPYHVMKTAVKALEVLDTMAREGNPNSVSDAGVGALAIRTAVEGAYLNVRINVTGLEDDPLKKEEWLKKAEKLKQEAVTVSEKISAEVLARL